MKTLTALIPIAAAFLVSLPVGAVNYRFDNYIGKVYVRDVDVRNIGSGMEYTINIITPSCGRNHHIDGYVQLEYRSPDGGWFRTRRHRFSGNDEEGIQRTFRDIVDYRMTEYGGRARVTTGAKCVCHRWCL